MKKLKFCLICLVSVLFVSCTNELIDVESSKSEVKTKAMSFETIILEDSILNFADNSALENALSDIENVSGLLKKKVLNLYITFLMTQWEMLTIIMTPKNIMKNLK